MILKQKTLSMMPIAFLESDKTKLVSQYQDLIDKSKIYVVGNYDLNFFNMDIQIFNSNDYKLSSNRIYI